MGSMHADRPQEPRPSLYAAWRWLCRNACLCSIVLALATAICVGIGVCLDECDKPGRDLDRFDLASDVIYETAQVMLLNMSPHLGSNGWITVGRVLAVLLVLFLGLQAMGRLLGDSWQNLLLMFYDRHHIICGLGRVGWQLTQDLIRQGEKVVVIEKDPANELCHDARRLGAVVIIGNATDDEMLKHAGLPKAKAVYVVTGSDEVNIEATVDVQAFAPPISEEPNSVPDCFVHILEPGLTEVLRSSLRTDGNQRMKVSAFNVMHNTARNLIVKHLTPIRPRADEEVALFVVVGFGRMGQTIAAQLAELAHFENRKRSRLLILTENPAASADTYLSRWGQFAPRVVVHDWSKIDFDPDADSWACQKYHPAPAYLAGNPNAIEYVCNAVFAPLPAYMAERGFLDALHRLMHEPKVKPAIIVCMDREDESYTMAVTLEQSLRRIKGMNDAHVFVWLPKQEPLKLLLTGDRRGVTPFGSCRDELRLDNVTDPLEEKLAIAIMAGFFQLDRRKDRAKILAKWQSDQEIFRQSNRSAAAHKLVALRCLGMRLVEPSEARNNHLTHLEATPDQIVTLAQMEHNRWVAERLLAGFSYGEKSDQPPRRPQLCSWDVLSTENTLKKEPEKDFQQITTVFETLRELGYALVKA